MRSTIVLAALLGLTCMLETGCKQSSTLRRWGGGPQGQGSMEDQKARAAVYDPYPLNDIGPEVVGGRPRGFTNPLSEPYRNEMKTKTASPWSSYPSY